MTVSNTWTNPSAGGSLDLSAGQLVTESIFDTFTSNLLYLGGATGAWVNWTPTLAQSAAITVTVQGARYLKIGPLAIVEVHLDITSAGSAGNSLVLAAIPAAIAPADVGTHEFAAGAAVFFDASATTRYHLAVNMTNSTSLLFFANASTGQFGSNPAVTAASGDVLSLAAAWRVVP